MEVMMKRKELSVSAVDSLSAQVALPMALTEAVELFHGEDQWREEAKEVKRMANALNDRLWSQSRLQEALSDSVETNSAVQDRIRANLLVHGAGLCGGDKERLVDIKFRLDQLASQYFANISSSVWVTLTANEVALLGDTAPVGDSTTVFLSEHVYRSIILYCPSEELRKKVFLTMANAHPENIPVLEQIVQLRLEMSRLLGFASFGDYSTRNMMVNSPNRVRDLLDNVERQCLTQMKRDRQQMSENFKPNENMTDQFLPWNIVHSQGLYVSSKFHLDGLELRNYFSPQDIFKGLCTLAYHNFGVIIEAAEWDSSDEGWTNLSMLQKFVAFDVDTNQPLGFLYLDLYQRAFKMPNPASVTLTPRFDVHPEDKEEGADQLGHAQVNGSKSLAHCVIFHSLENEAAGMSLGEVVVFFHEFGHVLHSLVGQTRHFLTSSVQAPNDFLEFPSTFLENYALDARFLTQYALHRVTRQAMPVKMAQAVQDAQKENQGASQNSDNCLARFDQLISSPDVKPGPWMDQAWKQATATDVFSAPGTRPYVNRVHLCHYGGHYFAYVAAKIAAMQTWQQRGFAANPFDSRAGRDLRRLVLERGVAQHPRTILESYLGQPLDASHLFRK